MLLIFPHLNRMIVNFIVTWLGQNGIRMISWACYRIVSENFFVVAHLSEYLGTSNIGIGAFGSTMDLYGMNTSAILTNSLLQSISLYQI